MRGKVGISYSLSAVNGITPAYAGKSLNGAAMWNVCTDHPRLCGEKHMEVYAICDITGSPPPMRGKEVDGNQRSLAYRITPAYAGKSFVMLTVKMRISDHPRLCGEKTKKIPKQRYFFHQPASFSFSLQYT